GRRNSQRIAQCARQTAAGSVAENTGRTNRRKHAVVAEMKRQRDVLASPNGESDRRERIPCRFCDNGPTKRGPVAHRQRSIFQQPTSTTRRASGSLCATFLRTPSQLRRGRSPYELRIKPSRCLSSCRPLRWPHSQRGDTRQYAG